MENEQNAVDEFLGDLANNGSIDPFEAKPQEDLFNEGSTEVKTEVKDAGEEVKEEKPLPFNKDPKVQRYIEKQIEKAVSQFKPEQPVINQTEEDKFKNVVDSFTAIIGNDTPEKVNALNSLRESLSNLDKSAAQEAIRALQAEREAELQAEREAEEKLNQGLESIEETYGVDITSSTPQARKLRGNFIDFVKNIAPKDNDGEISELPDLENSFKIFQSTRTPQQNIRGKQLASQTTERGSTSAEPVQKERISWDFVDRMFDSMSG